MSDYTKAEIAKDIARDMWRGLDRPAAALCVWYVVSWFLGLHALAFGFMTFIAVVVILDAAFQRTSAKSASEGWREAIEGWKAASEAAQEMQADRIEDMWFHVCVYTNFLESPHDAKRLIEGSQKLYADMHMVN